MQLRRLFVDADLHVGDGARLDSEQIHRLTRVLRLQAGDSIRIFTRAGNEFLAQLERSGRDWQVVAQEALSPQPESPLQVQLGQGIARGDRMDFTLQKSVELGVAAIQPLITERSHYAGDAARHHKRLSHWRRIVVQACEQCGRSRVPCVHEPELLADWLSQRTGGWVLQGAATTPAAQASFGGDAALLVGPEGGLSDPEIQLALAHGFTAVSLGPRTLRTETAAMVALTVLQLRGGDLG